MKNNKAWRSVGLVNEENSGAGQSGESLCHLADPGVIDEAAEKKQEAQHQKHPPQPVLSIKVTREVCGEPDNKNPFDEGEAKAGDGPIASGRRSGQTERQEKADPVEQEGHEESEHEDAIISYSQLISIIKIISGDKIFISSSYQGSRGLDFSSFCFIIGR